MLDLSRVPVQPQVSVASAAPSGSLGPVSISPLDRLRMVGSNNMPAKEITGGIERILAMLVANYHPKIDGDTRTKLNTEELRRAASDLIALCDGLPVNNNTTVSLPQSALSSFTGAFNPDFSRGYLAVQDPTAASDPRGKVTVVDLFDPQNSRLADLRFHKVIKIGFTDVGWGYALTLSVVNDQYIRGIHNLSTGRPALIDGLEPAKKGLTPSYELIELVTLPAGPKEPQKQIAIVRQDLVNTNDDNNSSSILLLEVTESGFKALKHIKIDHNSSSDELLKTIYDSRAKTYHLALEQLTDKTGLVPTVIDLRTLKSVRFPSKPSTSRDYYIRSFGVNLMGQPYILVGSAKSEGETESDTSRSYLKTRLGWRGITPNSTQFIDVLLSGYAGSMRLEDFGPSKTDMNLQLLLSSGVIRSKISFCRYSETAPDPNNHRSGDRFAIGSVILSHARTSGFLWHHLALIDRKQGTALVLPFNELAHNIVAGRDGFYAIVRRDSHSSFTPILIPYNYEKMKVEDRFKALGGDSLSFITHYETLFSRDLQSGYSIGRTSKSNLTVLDLVKEREILLPYEVDTHSLKPKLIQVGANEVALACRIRDTMGKEWDVLINLSEF